MDLQGMKRKQLQALCKKHGLPANATNAKMADSLAAFFEGGGGGTPDEEPPPERGRRGGDSGSKKKSAKKVTFFMEGNRVHEFIDLDSDSGEAEPARQSEGRRRRGASIRSSVVVVPNVTTRRQSKATGIRSPVRGGESDCGAGDAVLPRRITRSLVREISSAVEMGKATRQEGSKKRKSLATRGGEVGGVVKSSARTRSQMQMSKLESEDKLCETSEGGLKIEMGESGDHGDVKKRKNEEEAAVTVSNQAMQVRRTRSESRDEVCATKLETLKAEASVRSRRGVLEAELAHDELKTGEGGRERRSKSKKEVSGGVHCGSGNSTPKGTEAGLQAGREILRRSKRNVLKTVDPVANITNYEQNVKEGRRVKTREKQLEHKPSTPKDSILVNGEGTMHVEETAVEGQCQHARKSKRHALKSPISSHATAISSAKKARSSSKSQKKPKNCDVDNQNFHEMVSISTPNTCSVGKEVRKEQLNESSKAQGGEKSAEERDGEEQSESPEVEWRERDAGNAVEESMIKKLAVHPSEDVSEKFLYETNLTPSEPCKVMDICVSIQQSSYDEERVEQFQLSDEADEMLSSKNLVLAENSSSTLEDADLTKEDQGTEFESVSIGVSGYRTIEKEIDSPHGGTCFSSLFANREEDNQLFQKSTNYEEIHGCRLEVLEDKDSCYLHDEHLSRATNMEDFGASFDEVLSTKLSMLSEVDHAIQQQPLDCEKVFLNEKSRETGIKEGIDNSDIEIVDGCKLENGATPVYEAEDHMQTSVFEKSVSKTSFDIVQGSAEEFEKSVDSLGAFEATKTDMLMGQTAEEPIFYDKLIWGEISAERSDTNVDSTGVIAPKHENSHMLDGCILPLGENLLTYSKDQGNKMEVKCDMCLEKVETSESSWTSTCSPKRNMSASEQENKFALSEDNSVFSCPFGSVKVDKKNVCEVENNVSFYGNEIPCKNNHDNSTHEFVFNKVESSNENKEESKNNNSPQSMLLCGCEDYITPLNDQNKEDSENNNSLQSLLLPGCEESRKENGFIQDFDFGDEKPLSEEKKEDCEDKNSQLMPLRSSEGFRNEDGLVHDFNACDKNENSDAYEERKNLSSLKDENNEGSDDINSLQSVLLRGCEVSRNENGSAQGFNLGNENDNSNDYKQPVDDDLISTEEEEVSCQIDRKESIKACNEENVDQVDFHEGGFIIGNSSTEAPSADFVVSEHEKSTLETICNLEVSLKEITSPVCEDLSLRKEKRKSNMIRCESDFKDELKEDKEDTHEMILELYFDNKSTMGVDSLEVPDYGASEGLGSHRKAAAFELLPSNSPQNNCTGNVEVSNTGTAFSQEFCHEDDEGTSAGRTGLEGQHSSKKLKEKIAEIAGHLEEKYDHEEPNVSSAQKDVWVTDNSGQKGAAVEENFGYEKECLYAEEIFEMLSAMDSMPTKTGTPATSTEEKVKETGTVNEAFNPETGEFCDAYHQISKEEIYATEQREHDNIIELEEGGTKEQARKDTESSESTAEDPPALSNENIPHLQAPLLKAYGEINEVLNASELTGQEDFSLSNENAQCGKGAGSSADDIKDEHRAEAGLDGAQFSLAEDKEDFNFKFENCCDPEVSKESILQIDVEDALNIGLMKDTSERNENDMVQIVESDDTLENQGQEHKVMSPLSTRKNGQQSACSEGESIENADRDTLTCEESIDCEIILHNNKFDMQNEELLGNRDDELVERKLISPPKETLRQKDQNAEQTNSFGGCEKLSNVSTSRSHYKGFKNNSSECNNRSMIHTMVNEDSLENQAEDHESTSPLSTKMNEQQQSVFSEGESIENANRENISYEVILHSNLDFQNELLDQDGEVVETKLVSPMEMLSQNDVIAEQINNFGCKGLSNMTTSHTDSIGLLEGETLTEEHKEAIVTEVPEDMNISLEPGADSNVQDDEEMIERQDAKNEEADDIRDSFTKLFEIEEDFDYEAAMERIEALNLETQMDEVNNLLANMQVSSGRKAGDRAGKARSKTFNPISKLKKWFSTSEMKENSHVKQKPVRKNDSTEKSSTPVSRRRPLKQIGNQ